MIGLDVGSTTIKCVVLSDADQIVYQTYERHFSQITAKTVEMLRAVAERFPAEREWRLAIAGSAGMGMAEFAKVPFVQEVYAAKLAAERNAPGTDCIIELGGEDAKILFVSNGGMEARMNGTCAGGTGAFIDQMATLLDVDAADMDALAGQHERVYTIASRCGVFAKSDIQPLLNQGAKKSDIAASIFYAVVNQTIGGLAQGRPVKGNILYLGGPLTFMPMLRRCFDEVLGVTGTCPENSLYYVSLGAAYAAKERCDLPAVIETLKQYVSHSEWETLPPLFETEAEYEAFRARHAAADVPRGTLETLAGPAYLGIDAGSTTLKAVVTDESGALLHSAYLSNSGNPVPVIRDFLLDLYRRKPDLHIAAACVTGYGEDIIKNAFHVDYGLVETMAHFTAARRFMPEVEFIVDIGGQDMKCFHVQGGVVDKYLSE